MGGCTLLRGNVLGGTVFGEEEGNSCVYSRQSGGREVVIKIDNSVICQAQFRCKKE